MRTYTAVLVLCSAVAFFPPSAYSTNDHGLPGADQEQRARDQDAHGAYIASGCSFVVPSSSLTLAAQACDTYTGEGPAGQKELVFARQAAVALTLTAVDGTHWIAMDTSTFATRTGWTRSVFGAHYLTQQAATQPAPIDGVFIVTEVTVATSVITVVRTFAPRSAQSAQDSIHYVNDYGALPDDGLDDTAAFQAAIDAFEPSGGGGTVHMGLGEYTLLSTVECDGHYLVMRGVSKRGTTVNATGVTGFAFECDGTTGAAPNTNTIDTITFRDFELNMDADGVSGILFIEPRTTLVENIRFRAGGGGGRDGTALRYQIRVGGTFGFDNVIRENYFAGMLVGVRMDTNITSSKIINNLFNAAGGQPSTIAISYPTSGGGSGHIIQGNGFDNWQTAISSSGTYLQIIGNRFELNTINCTILRGDPGQRIWTILMGNTFHDAAPCTFPKNNVDEMFQVDIQNPVYFGIQDITMGDSLFPRGGEDTQTHLRQIHSIPLPNFAPGNWQRVAQCSLEAQGDNCSVYGRVTMPRLGVTSNRQYAFALNVAQTAAMGSPPTTFLDVHGNYGSGELRAVITDNTAILTRVVLFLENTSDANTTLIYDLVTWGNGLGNLFDGEEVENLSGAPVGTTVSTISATHEFLAPIDATNAGLQTKVSINNVNDTVPTNAELDTAFGQPAAVGAGFLGVINDAGLNVRVFLVISDGTAWHSQLLTVAP
jgi:hypothetical protein